jgi:metacaspase-1
MAIDMLCLHGVNVDENGGWLDEWAGAIRSASADRFDFTPHDHRYNAHFAARSANSQAYRRALTRLLDSVWRHRELRGRGGPSRGLRERIEATIGMVVKWAAYDDLRALLRAELKQRIEQLQPQIVCAHSLGSLIAYDLLAGEQALMRGRVFITLGSQIAHPALRDVFAGKLVALESATHWFHLFNDEDALFTRRLDFDSDNFTQVDASFDRPGALDHDAVGYLSAEATARRVWPTFAARAAAKAAAAGPSKPWFKAPAVVSGAPRPRRALLVGIDDYPNPDDRLSGCVNDAFLMSSVLQERGYEPEAIRLVLNERATTQGVLDRLDWLFDGVRAGDERVLLFSGHGARVASYGATGEPDHKDEVLVTHDFDWNHNLGVSDDMLALRYAGLPYEARVTLILDCCHSGGMSRAGGRRIRGIDPPDDVQHRSIRWNAQRQLWVARERINLKQRLDRSARRVVQRFVGANADTQRLGRAVCYWADDPRQYKAAKQRLGHKGPYNPVIVAACREDQYAEEYRHGAASFGALSFVLAKELRRSGGRATLEDLLALCNEQMHDDLGLEQVAELYRPPGHAQTQFPGQVQRAARPARKRKPSR